MDKYIKNLTWNGKQNILSYILWRKIGVLFTGDKKKFTRLRARMLSLICIAQGKSCVAVGLNLGGASMPLLEEAEFVFHPI